MEIFVRKRFQFQCGTNILPEVVFLSPKSFEGGETGALNLKSPVGGSAYGTPRYEVKLAFLSVAPCRVTST